MLGRLEGNSSDPVFRSAINLLNSHPDARKISPILILLCKWRLIDGNLQIAFDSQRTLRAFGESIPPNPGDVIGTLLISFIMASNAWGYEALRWRLDFGYLHPSPPVHSSNWFMHNSLHIELAVRDRVNILSGKIQSQIDQIMDLGGEW